MIVFNALLIVIFSFVKGVPNIQNQVKHDLKTKGEGKFLITFNHANFEAASSADQMYSHAKLKKSLGCLDVKSVDEFVEKGEYHKTRGAYVLNRVHDHHQECKNILLDYVTEGDIISSIPISNTFLIECKKSQIRGLANRDDVIEIFSNKPFKIDLPKVKEIINSQQKTAALHLARTENDLASKKIVLSSPQWNIQKINAPKVWAMDSVRGRGKGVVYASADTGVSYKHPVLNKSYRGRFPDGRYDHNYNWYDGVRRKISDGPKSKCGHGVREPCDDQGHGTHVMSTAIGSDGIGVAPDAQWIACKNMDNGVGSPETYLNCLNFFLAPHDLNGKNPDPSKRPHVVGNSYGCPDAEGCSPNAMTAAMEALRAAGVFMSVSAGNNGPKCGTITDPPAIEPLGFSVGAVDRTDIIAPFSSRGPVNLGGKTFIKPDICAPGADINGAIGASGYRRMSGTSMASPHVSGLAILMTAMCPCIARNVEQIEYFIQMTAMPKAAEDLCALDEPDAVPNCTYGWGRIDAAAAVNACREYCRMQSS